MTHGAGGEIVQAISNLPSAREGSWTMFLSPKSFLWGFLTQESNSFVPIYLFSYPEITQYPESTFYFSFLAIAFFFLASEMEPFPLSMKEEKATQDEG